MRSSVGKAVSYFHANQVTSGGFGAAGQRVSMTPWVVQAIAAAGKSPSTFKRSGGKSPIAYLQSLNMASQATSGSGTTSNPADFYAKMIITYHAAKLSSLITKAGSKHINLVVISSSTRTARAVSSPRRWGGAAPTPPSPRPPGR